MENNLEKISKSILESKILIIDDNTLFTKGCKNQMEKIGFNNIDVTADPENALRLLEEKKHVLILSDIMLNSEIDGIKICSIIKKRFSKPIIVLYSGLTDNNILKKAKEAGADELIDKSIGFKNIITVITEWLETYWLREKCDLSEIDSKEINLKSLIFDFIKTVEESNDHFEISGKGLFLIRGLFELSLGFSLQEVKKEIENVVKELIKTIIIPSFEKIPDNLKRKLFISYDKDFIEEIYLICSFQMQEVIENIFCDKGNLSFVKSLRQKRQEEKEKTIQNLVRISSRI